MTYKILFNIPLTVFCLFIINTEFIEGCGGIRNVIAKIKDSTDKWSNASLNGCITRLSFGDQIITEVHIKDQKISVLGKDYVKNFPKLDVLEFKNCDIESVARGAFRNLDRIRVVGITHNPKLSVITGGIFDIFETIHILRLNNNNISTLTDEALSNMTLHEVNFSYNSFTKFDPVWFAYSPYIKHLYFQNNQIEKIPKRAFDTMQKLQNINFDNNRISDIQEGAFRKLENLSNLRLKNNLLFTIRADVFPNKININYLNLAGNYMRNIPVETLKKINLKEISIDYNPFLCSCHLVLNQYFQQNNISLRQPDRCNLNFLPFCLQTETECKEPENAAETKKIDEIAQKFFNEYKKLQPADKKCASFGQFL